MSTPAAPARRGRPRGPVRELRAEEIVQAALEIGVETFTMKDIARHVGVSYQVLYRWVTGRDEILDMVADHLVEQIIPPPLDEGGDWRSWLLDFALQLRRELLTVPGMALRGLTRYHVSVAFVRLHARGVEALMAGGMSGARAAASIEAYGTGILAWVAREQSIREQRVAGRRFADEITDARREAALRDARPAAPRRGADDRYADYVRTLIAGIAARAAEERDAS